MKMIEVATQLAEVKTFVNHDGGVGMKFTFDNGIEMTSLFSTVGIHRGDLAKDTIWIENQGDEGIARIIHDIEAGKFTPAWCHDRKED